MHFFSISVVSVVAWLVFSIPYAFIRKHKKIFGGMTDMEVSRKLRGLEEDASEESSAYYDNPLLWKSNAQRDERHQKRSQEMRSLEGALQKHQPSASFEWVWVGWLALSILGCVVFPIIALFA